MDNRNAHTSGGGFLLGVLIGVLIALLFTTKKGRRILKSLTEEGMDKISNIEELFEKKLREESTDDMGIGDFEVKHEMHEVVSSPSPVTTHHPHINHTHETDSHVYSHHYPQQETHIHENNVVHESHDHIADTTKTRLEDFVQQMHEPEVPTFTRPVSASRRFFRGIPKRSSN